jgi:hypothetical protein
MKVAKDIPWDGTVRNRVISDAVRICLSDRYAELFNDYETKFLLTLFHAPPDYFLSQRQGRFLSKLYKRTLTADCRLGRSAWRDRR